MSTLLAVLLAWVLVSLPVSVLAGLFIEAGNGDPKQ